MIEFNDGDETLAERLKISSKMLHDKGYPLTAADMIEAVEAISTGDDIREAMRAINDRVDSLEKCLVMVAEDLGFVGGDNNQ